MDTSAEQVMLLRNTMLLLYSPECVERLSEKGSEGGFEGGFGRYEEAEMGPKVPSR